MEADVDWMWGKENLVVKEPICSWIHILVIFLLFRLGNIGSLTNFIEGQAQILKPHVVTS